MPAFDPGRFRSSKHKFKKCRALRIKYLVKSVSYKFCTKFAKSGGLEKNGRRERILGLRCFVAVRRFMCEGPCLLGIFPRLKGDREFWTRTRWRRERNWIPTFSRRIANDFGALRFNSPQGRPNPPTQHPSLSMSNSPSSLWNGPGGKGSSRSRTASLGRHSRTPSGVQTIRRLTSMKCLIMASRTTSLDTPSSRRPSSAVVS
jgi:hypothetical protein